MNYILPLIVLLLFLNSSWVMAGVCVVVVILVFLINLISRQESMLYVPCVMPGMQTPENNPEGLRSPADKNLIYEDVYMETTDGVQLHAWFISVSTKEENDDGEGTPHHVKGKEDEAPTLLFCHANAGNIGLRVPNFAEVVDRLQANILALDYRGYGQSKGEPSEEGLIEDALTAWRWLQSAASKGRISPDKVFVFGRSLGGAVAIALTHELRRRQKVLPKAGTLIPAGLILENTFLSISAVVDVLFPLIAFQSLKERFLRLSWDSVSRIATLEVPILFLSGTQDELIPPAHMQALKAAASSSRLIRLVAFPEGKHNDTWEKGGDEYWEAQETFFKDCLALEPLKVQSSPT
eukprot:CAMPEP_0178395720 /NCGR_PEP_ID=MMETSP0689_2-20121128/13363_1 /TAXON_ID=160604 /ORGANISM="Amphidinium massartii, Strain CS-259" /LENGTH=350 /DNA_ID=CAMNT_0020016381 /DNA_START=41 /DNA_END=1089 /DNA_ORIENTATION=+